MSKLSAVAVLAAAVSAQKCIQPGWRNRSYVRESPGAEDITYSSQCQPWKDNTCCTAEYTQQLARGGIGAIYNNFSYDYCGTMSPRCRQFLEWEECFYACDPYAAYFEDPVTTGSFKNLPLCKNFCDDWFDACKDDFTCATDWVNDFTGDFVDGVYVWKGCTDPTCTKFSARFQDGTDMCNRMWDTNFVVSSDPKKCFTPWFYSVNPNNNPAGIKASGAASTAVGMLAALGVVAAVAMGAGAAGARDE